MNLVRIMSTIAALLFLFVANVIAGKKKSLPKNKGTAGRDRRDAGNYLVYCIDMTSSLPSLYRKFNPILVIQPLAAKKVKIQPVWVAVGPPNFLTFS